MNIIIDQITNKILRYGENETPNEGEYQIWRNVDFSSWEDYEIFYNPLRGIFEKGDHKLFKKWLEENNDIL